MFENEKRYWSFGAAMRRRFGGRVAKIPLDGGFTCPNRDGTKGFGGCSFCSARGSGDFTLAKASMEQQWAYWRGPMEKKWKPVGYLGYFQAFSGTYAPLDALQEKYETALRQPGCLGLIIGTRPDCLTPAIADYLQSLSQRCFMLVELGLQSIHESTTRRIHRGCSLKEWEQGWQLLYERNIDTGVHLINGLPGEEPRHMLESAQWVARRPFYCIKIHSLHVLKDTRLADEYLRGDFSLQSREEYVAVVCDQLEILPPHLIVARLTGDGKGSQLLAPDWSRNKRAVIHAIDHELTRRQSWQGKKHCNQGSFLI